MLCPICNEPCRVMIWKDEFPNIHAEQANDPIQTSTLLSYSSPEGHNHDDNCLTRSYICYNKHITKIGLRCKCNKCSWKGKETCGCHHGLKVDKFPE